MTRRRYSQAERDQAVALATTCGYKVAGAELHIPPRTVQTWQRRALERAEVMVGTAVVRDGRPWAERREAVLPMLADFVVTAIPVATVKAAAGDGRVAQSLVTAAAIAIDKLQLLTGAATSRSESSSLRAEVKPEELVAWRQQFLPAELQEAGGG